MSRFRAARKHLSWSALTMADARLSTPFMVQVRDSALRTFLRALPQLYTICGQQSSFCSHQVHLWNEAVRNRLQ